MSGCLAVVACLLASCAAAQTPAVPLTITSTALPGAKLRQAYSFELRATGVPPLQWEVAAGALPPGVKLDAKSGRMTGAATAVGEFHFTVRVSDGEQPPRTAEREFTLTVVAPLTVQWKVYPQVANNNAIQGSALVSNGTDEAFDITFIVVAVNEIGKAFALGYQHFTLSPERSSPVLEFGSTLPAGQYIVHVDVVAEVPARNAIYRARLQTKERLALTGLP